MLDKSKIKTQIFIARNQKKDIYKDIEDTELYIQEYIFKKMIFRIFYLFLLCFVIFSVVAIKDIFLEQELFSKIFFLNIFKNSILYSFLISGIYAIFGSFIYGKEYKLKDLKVEKYFSELDNLED